MMIDKPTNIKIVKEHLNDGITLKELKEILSLHKEHKEDNETIIETAIRECYEETNIIVSKDDLIKELASYSYEFLSPSNKLIR